MRSAPLRLAAFLPEELIGVSIASSIKRDFVPIFFYNVIGMRKLLLLRRPSYRNRCDRYHRDKKRAALRLDLKIRPARRLLLVRFHTAPSEFFLRYRDTDSKYKVVWRHGPSLGAMVIN